MVERPVVAERKIRRRRARSSTEDDDLSLSLIFWILVNDLAAASLFTMPAVVLVDTIQCRIPLRCLFTVVFSVMFSYNLRCL